MFFYYADNLKEVKVSTIVNINFFLKIVQILGAN